MDEVRVGEVFTLATANDIDKLGLSQNAKRGSPEKIQRELLQGHCSAGYDLYSYYRREDSAAFTARQEHDIAAEVARCERMVRELLVKCRGFLDAVA